MALMEIKVFGCPALRKRALPVEAVTGEVQRLVEDMFETMYHANGVGLAAPQVGAGMRVIVVDVVPHDPSAVPMALIDPEVVWSAGEEIGEEGCLSLPEVVGDVKRAAQVRVRALDGEGAPVEMSIDGIAARVVQHEIDHLDGILITDHFSTIKRNLLRGQLRRLRREGRCQASEVTRVASEAPKGVREREIAG